MRLKSFGPVFGIAWYFNLGDCWRMHCNKLQTIWIAYNLLLLIERRKINIHSIPADKLFKILDVSMWNYILHQKTDHSFYYFTLPYVILYSIYYYYYVLCYILYYLSLFSLLYKMSSGRAGPYLCIPSCIHHTPWSVWHLIVTQNINFEWINNQKEA